MIRLCIFVLCLAAAASLKAQANDDIVHTVAAGETLTLIANAYGVTLERLLSLNELDPDAYLQIGQRLVVIPADEIAQPEGEAEDEAEADAAEEAEAALPLPSVDAPHAPVAQADAPMMDPADIGPQLCFALFEDDNQNGHREPGERYLEAGRILLLDASGGEALSYTTDGESEPYCRRDLARELYHLELRPPDGYGATSAASLQIDLRAGGSVNVEFGAKRGLETFIVPTAEASPTGPPVVDEGESSLLREASGIFVLALAGVVLMGGLIVSLLLRGRT